MKQTTYSLSHNTGGNGRLLRISVDYRRVDDSSHVNVRGDSRGNDGRCESSSQEISNYSFQNYGDSYDGDGRSVYRSQTIPYSYHYLGDLGRLLGFSIHGHKRGGHRSQTR